MAEYTEQVLDLEFRGSRHLDGSLASICFRERIQVLRDGEPIGAPEWRATGYWPISPDKTPVLSREQVVEIFGEAATKAREDLAELSAQHIAKRGAWEAEKADMQAAHAAELQSKEAVIAGLEAEKAARQ